MSALRLSGGPCLVEIDIAGERLVLLPEKALFWPARGWLLVADVHLGKAASFRAMGVPVPGGTTRETLDRLDAAIRRVEPARIVFLGDFLHSRAGRAPATLELAAQWRAGHGAIEMVLVRGNHDRHAGDPPASLAIDTVAEPFQAAPFLLCHHPEPREEGYVLAGHLHPAVRLFGRGRDSVRLPCFHFGERVGCLPAFGAFTGSALITPVRGERCFVVADDCVVETPVR